MCLLVLNFLLLSYNINVFIDVFIVVLAFYNEKIVFVLHRNLMIIYFVFFNEHLVLHKKYKQNALNACPPKKGGGTAYNYTTLLKNKNIN